MPYVGNPLADAFSSREKQDLTGQSGTSFTLTHAVSHANDLSVYINHVRQEPTTAYTVNGTTLTTTGSVAGTDDFYIIYDELALQSISHPSDQALTATSGTFTSGLVGTTATFSGALSATTGTFSGAVDIQGQELILDADNDTSITADTDDRIDFRTAGADVVHIDSAGNVGIGTIPESWHSNWSMIDIGNRGAIGQYKTDGDIQLAFNTYHDGAWKIKETGQAGRYVIGGVTDLYHIWYTGSNANTDAATTMTERMRIDAAGNLGLGHVPYGHHANWSHIDIGEKCGIGHYHGGDSVVSHNNYYDGQWKAKETGIATQLNFTAAGQTIFRYADSTSAGAAISWQNCLEINTDGTVKIGVKDQQPNNAWALRCFNTHGTHATIEGWNDNSGGKNLNLFRHDDASIFQVSNGGAVWAAGGYTSDKAFKNVIGDCTEGWSKLKDVKPKSYRYKNIHYEEKDGEEVEVFSDDDMDSNIHYGVIAQDLKKVLPDITYGEEGKMSVDYHGLLMVAINTIKELEARITALENK